MSRSPQGDQSTDVGFDRDFLMRQLDYEVKRAKRYGRTIGLAMLGVDDLDSVRTRYGPQVAAQLLAWVTDRLENICRDADILCQLGDGHYAIIMPEADTEGARMASERLRKDVSSYGGGARPAQSVSVSVGVAVLLECKTTAARPLITMAEQCLRKASSNGPSSSIVIEARL